MISLGPGANVYLALGSTDMRKGIDSLSVLVAKHLDGDPFSGDVICLLQLTANGDQDAHVGPERILGFSQAA